MTNTKPFTAKQILREFYSAAASTNTLADLKTVIDGYAATLDAWKASGDSPKRPNGA
jgi:hypothetical protein